MFSSTQFDINLYFRRWMLERKLADADVSEEEQNRIMKDLEKKETEYMRLRRHKMGVDDFELLTIIGRGAFGEVTNILTCRFCNTHQFTQFLESFELVHAGNFSIALETIMFSVFAFCLPPVYTPHWYFAGETL